MKRTLSVIALVSLALLLAGCPNQTKKKALEDRLRQYEQTIRWSEWEAAVNYLAPESQIENPVTQLDIDRLRMFRVTNYTVRSTSPAPDGKSLQQTVEIRFFHKTQARERVIRDNQDWRQDEESKVWLLHSGLPDVTQGR